MLESIVFTCRALQAMCIRSITAAVGARRAKATIKASGIDLLSAFRTHKAGG